MNLRLWYLPLVIWVIFEFPVQAQNGAWEKDSLTLKGLNTLIDDYLTLFTLSDVNGHMHNHLENRFRDLYADTSRIVSVIPGRDSYLQSISVDTYISLMRQVLSDKIVRPGTNMDYSVTPKREKVAQEGEVFEVLIQKHVLIFDKESYELLYDLTIPLEVEVLSVRERNLFLIQNITYQKEKKAELVFRMVYADRSPARGLGVDFTYLDDDDTQITRRRHSDHNGLVYISNLPDDTPVNISTMPPFEVVLPQEKTANQWMRVAEQNRFLLVYEKTPKSVESRPYAFSVGLAYPFMALPSSLNLPGKLSLNSHQISQMSGKPGWYAYVSRQFKIAPFLKLELGTGLDYIPFKLDSEVVSPVYLQGRHESINCEHAHCRVASKIVRESYSFDALYLPFIVSLKYPVKGKMLRSIGLQGKMRYELLSKLSYTAHLQSSGGQEENPSEDIFIYGPKTASALPGPDRSVFKGTVDQRPGWSMSLSAIFQFNLYKEFVLLDYYISYHMQNLGENEAAHMYRNGDNSYSYYFNPLLITSQFSYNNILFGLGLSYKF